MSKFYQKMNDRLQRAIINESITMSKSGNIRDFYKDNLEDISALIDENLDGMITRKELKRFIEKE